VNAPVASMRIVPELRAAHIERHRLGTPAELLYLGTNYDLAGTPVAGGIQRVTVAGALGRFFRTNATTLEVPEPLWMRFWPKHVVLVVGFRAAGVLRRRAHRVVTYARENNDIATLVGGRRAAPAWTVRAVATLIGATARLTIDRIAFASAASRAAYRALPFVDGIEQAATIELPRAVAATPPDVPPTCVFVGAMEHRKGVRALIEAWPLVEAEVPGARLVLVGPGPLLDETSAWAAESPSTRCVVGRLPHTEAARVLRSATALVAPSVPDGRWREQIGLPIKEALAAGVTIVTTEQTGLAGWLRDHGHEVVGHAGTSFTRRLSRAIVRVLRAPLDRDQVRASLPETDGRLVADAWLHGATARLVADVADRPIQAQS
jgi:glycosyltransferase involved in cell wall biosynthesis